MMECRQIESALAPFVDGQASHEDHQRVEGHLGQCPACRRAVAQQEAVRAALRRHAPALVGQAPPGLHTRLQALGRAALVAPRRARLAWPARLGAFAAAAALVLALAGTALSVLSPQSDVLFAAQLALDHLKCFVIDGHTDQPTITRAAAETALRERYGWSLDVPEARPESGLRLVAVRRCLYGEGWIAHVLYRLEDTPVSVYVIPGRHHDGMALPAFGQSARVLAQGDETLVIVAPAQTADRVAALVRSEAE